MIELLSISPTSNWSNQKQKMWAHLQLLATRIIEKNIDVTSNLGSDYFTIRYTFAIFSEAENCNTLYHKICALAADYNYDRCEEDYQAAIKKSKYKTIKSFIHICQYHQIDTLFEDEATPSPDTKKDYLPDGADETLFDTYGFFAKENQYFTMEQADKKWYPKPFTNFTMRVLFHMNNGMQPRRIIEVTNIRHRKKVVDIPTDKLVSKNEFKKFLEGLGNFRFFGTEGKLDMLKGYLYDQEAECHEINVLGWHEDGFWTWSNGIYNSRFNETDDNGFVELHDKHYYIPSGNTQQPNRGRRFSNELRFKHYRDQKITFAHFATQYCNVFGENGNIILMFAVACLFSDIVFNTKGYFPILFVYGEGGSGKGSAIKFAQRLFGSPQDPLTLSGKANTDKAKIAVFAQFINSMLLLEEYANNHDTDQLLKNLWDRYGYKRRTMDMGYGTETVPIQSGVAVTGNFSPSDDPLLQRLIYLEHNINQFTDDQRHLFNELKQLSEKGVTSATHELLKLRHVIEKNYREAHIANSRRLIPQFTGVHVTDRMVENIAVPITIYELLSGEGLQFPFTLKELVTLLVKATISQNEKRDSGGEVQKFFDIFLHLVQTGILEEDIHYRINSNHFYFNFKTIYGYYAEHHRRQYSVGAPSHSNMRDKLKVHTAYVKYEDSYHIGAIRTSCYVFAYDKLAIDLVGATETRKAVINKHKPITQSFEEKTKQPQKQKNDMDEELPFP